MLTMEMLKHIKVYLKPGHTDMRKQVNGLAMIVEQNMNLDPLSGSLFVFCSRHRRILKILYWDKNGFCIWYKRLEEERFRWPKNAQEAIQISNEQLIWLLSGLDFKSAHRELNYSSFT